MEEDVWFMDLLTDVPLNMITFQLIVQANKGIIIPLLGNLALSGDEYKLSPYFTYDEDAEEFFWLFINRSK